MGMSRLTRGLLAALGVLVCCSSSRGLRGMDFGRLGVCTTDALGRGGLAVLFGRSPIERH